jgi:hypothetical protein
MGRGASSRRSRWLRGHRPSGFVCSWIATRRRPARTLAVLTVIVENILPPLLLIAGLVTPAEGDVPRSARAAAQTGSEGTRWRWSPPVKGSAAGARKLSGAAGWKPFLRRVWGADQPARPALALRCACTLLQQAGPPTRQPRREGQWTCARGRRLAQRRGGLRRRRPRSGPRSPGDPAKPRAREDVGHCCCCWVQPLWSGESWFCRRAAPGQRPGGLRPGQARTAVAGPRWREGAMIGAVCFKAFPASGPGLPGALLSSGKESAAACRGIGDVTGGPLPYTPASWGAPSQPMV